MGLIRKPQTRKAASAVWRRCSLLREAQIFWILFSATTHLLEIYNLKAMNKPFSRIASTTVLCLAAVGLSSCIQTSDLDAADSEPPLPAVFAVKLPPLAQKALAKTLSGELVPNESYEEDISGYLQNSSEETRYIMRVLANNKCDLGDGHSILRTGILPNLCRDLDELLKQETPSAEILDHAVWMASKLELHNLITFLVNLGAPSNKYKLGE